MPDQIIALPISSDTWTDETPRPQPSAFITTNGTDNAYLCNDTDLADWTPDSWLIGSWSEYTGKPLSVITDDYEAWIRLLGNSSGIATGLLDSHRWAGHSEAKYFEYDDTDPEDIKAERYPSTNRPFTLKITREDHTDDPTWPGWGWRVDMLSDDSLRDITARAIGIYSDPEATQYLFTSGAFLDDVNGTFYTECPVGQRSADEQPIYFALLLGSAQEGIWNMPIGVSEDERQFWNGDQGGTGSSYIDSGEVVTGGAGTVTLMADNSQFAVGDKIRIEGVESVVTSKWTGTGLVLDPYTLYTNGSVIEVWR